MDNFMKTICKYELAITEDVHCIEMPVGATILSIDSNPPMMWVMVDPDARKEPRWFHAFAIGQLIPDTISLAFVGSMSAMSDSLTLHVFEEYR